MKMKRFLAVILLVVICLSTGISIFAAAPYVGYTYDNNGLAVGAPLAYSFEASVNGIDLGIGSLSSATDMCVDKDSNIYINDSKNSRIIILDKDLEVVRIIGCIEGVMGGEITYKGETVTLNGSMGMYVWEYFGKKHIYICDSNSARIVRIDLAGQLEKKDSLEAACQPIEVLTIYNEPVITIYKDNMVYKPAKIVVDRAERMHVLCQSINRGIVKLNPDGAFNCFYAAPEVSIPAAEKFWRAISNNKQLETMLKFVSTEYDNITIDPDGFVWVVTSTIGDDKIRDSLLTTYDNIAGRQEAAPVKKVNSYGDDITSRTGTYPPVGDIAGITVDASGISSIAISASLQALAGMSRFEDIVVDKYGCYSILDDQRKRIFTYDCDGNLLFQFGNDGTQLGTFKSPVAVDYFINDKIVVLDSYDNALMIFSPTDYGRTTLQAVRAYQTGFYEESERLWGEVLEMNSNCMQAYSGVGKSLYRSNKYKEAMEYFTISKNVEYYSKALKEYINQVIGKGFSIVFIVIIAVIVISWLVKKIKQFRHFLQNGVKKVM